MAVINIHGLRIEDQAFMADPVFFRKEQLTIGTKLVYLGRTDPNSVWEVAKIHQNYSARNIFYEKVIRHRNIKTPETFLSLIFLRRISNSPQTKLKGYRKMGHRLELNFGYLSYSAIWRIVP
jgi:hypothetical protein